MILIVLLLCTISTAQTSKIDSTHVLVSKEELQFIITSFVELKAYQQKDSVCNYRIDLLQGIVSRQEEKISLLENTIKLKDEQINIIKPTSWFEENKIYIYSGGAFLIGFILGGH